MSQGNSNKVNAIVDEIVKNNSVFKLKSAIEQDKEKESMAKSINTALSALNEVGKELVLQDLSVDPDEKFKVFIDSAGNVDISGLTQFTTTIVKEKIEEAKREGLDLRKDSPNVLENKKIHLANSILTIAAIDTMIKDFDKLSSKDRNILADNWLSMTNIQKFAYREALGKVLQDNAQIIDNPKTQEQLNGLSQEAQNSQDRYNHTLKAFRELPKKEQIQWIEDILGRKLSNTEISSGNFESIFTDAYFQPEAILNKQETNLANQLEKFKLLKNDSKTSQQAITQYNQAISNSTNQTFDNRLAMDYIRNVSPSKRKTIPLEIFKALDQSKKREILAEQVPGYMESKKEVTKKSYNNPETLKTQISNITITLAKANFSQEEIKESLKIYKSTLESLEADDLDEFINGVIDENGIRTLIPEPEKINKINQYLIEDGIPSKIAEILSKIDYNGQLFEILRDETKRKEFLEQLDQVINPTKEQQITDADVQKGIDAGRVTEDTLDASAAIEAQQDRVLEKQPKEQKEKQKTPPVANQQSAPEEHTQKSTTSSYEEITQENTQNMALVEQDNSFIGKIKRVMANMREMKNKDNSKGFFSRLGTSIQTVFGNKKEEYYTEQEDTEQQNTATSTSRLDQQLTLDEQLRQGVDLNKFNQVPVVNTNQKRQVQRSNAEKEDFTQ